MKIAIVVWDLTISGGTQRQALELASKLSKNHEVKVYAGKLNRKSCYPNLISNLNIVSLPYISAPDAPEGRWYRFYNQYHFEDESTKKLASLISLDTDVINLHDINTEKVAYYFKKNSPNTPTIMMMNDLPSVFFTKERYSVNKIQPTLKQQAGDLVEKSFKKIIEVQTRKYMKSVNRIIVLDQRNKHLVNKYLRREVTVVRSGLEITQFKPKFQKTNKVFTILATGIFFRWRRFEDLISAIAILIKQGYSVHLNIVGNDKYDPTYAKEIKQQAKSLKVYENVSFLGSVSDSKLAKLYRNANAFVFPNHNQTWGLAVVEAMASGTAVIVSKTAGVHEIITDNVNGLLINPLDPDDIAQKLSILIDEPLKAREIARNGYQYVVNNISWDKYAEKVERILTT